MNHPDRLLHPLMRRHGRNSPLERVSWDETLQARARAAVLHRLAASAEMSGLEQHLKSESSPYQMRRHLS